MTLKGMLTGTATASAVMALGLLALGAAIEPALAGLGQPTPGGIGLQQSATPIMEYLTWFHDVLLLPIITVISIFVGGLLIYCMWAFSETRNPVPSKTTHNTTIEVVWTVVPVLILIVIAIPSFRLLYQEQTLPRDAITIKATGKQWFWSYEYVDHGKFTFDQIMLNDKDIADRVAKGEQRANMPRLLAVDNEVVVPVGQNVRVQVTAADVLHAFAVPGFGVKIDAVPGRLNETWFRATREGIFYGQCSELCGKDHAFMPLAIRVVSEQTFTQWVDQAKKRFASGQPPLSVAELQSQQRVADAAPSTR